MDRAEEFIEEMRQSKTTEWIADEIEETLVQGISMNAKEALNDAGFFQLKRSNEITTRDRNRRQNYETSRPFSEDEKTELIIKALKSIYLELPKIKLSALENIRDLEISATEIRFYSSEDEATNQHETLKITLKETKLEAETAEKSYESFIHEVENDDHS